MLAYCVLVFIPVLLFCITAMQQSNANNRYKKLKHRTYILTSFFFTLFILLSVRHITIGTDVIGYLHLYEDISTEQLDDLLLRYEIGYALLNKIIAIIFDDFQILLIVIAGISIFPLYFLYKEYNYKPLLTVSLFLTVAPFSVYFSGLRQIIAMGFAIAAYYCAKNNKLLLFVFVIFFAMLFHKSSIILCLLYPLCRIKIRKKMFPVIVCIFTLLLMCGEKFFVLFINLLPTRYIERYSEISFTGAYSFLLFLVLLVLYTFFLVDEKKANKDFFILRNILVLATFLQSFALLNPVAMRLNYYFLIFIPILIPQVSLFYSKNSRELVMLSNIIMPIGLITIFFYQAYTSADILDVYPYRFFWE